MEINGKTAILGDQLGILLGENRLEEFVSIAIQILREVSHRGRIRVYDTFKTRYLVAQLLAAYGVLDVVQPGTISIATHCTPISSSLDADSTTFILTDSGRKALAELTKKYHN